jgi:hypothetical protein
VCDSSAGQLLLADVEVAQVINSECDSPVGGKCDSPAGQLFLADVEVAQVINSECDSPAGQLLLADIEVAQVINSECESPAVGDSTLLAVDLDLPRVIKSSLKHISFNSLVGVVFIPCIAEYREAGLLDALWWRPVDFRGFKSAAASALKKFMRQHNLVNKRDALKKFIRHEQT